MSCRSSTSEVATSEVVARWGDLGCELDLDLDLVLDLDLEGLDLREDLEEDLDEDFEVACQSSG